MNVLNIVNESKRIIGKQDLLTLAQLLSDMSAKVTVAWGLPMANILPAPARGSGWNVVIVDKFPNLTMQKNLGYHEVVNGQPIAYIRADCYGSRSIFGTYSPAFKIKGIQLHGSRLTPGLLTVAAHELAEMLVDPMVDKLSLPDAKGQSWVLEVCDHTVGFWRSIVNNVSGILPDFTTPAFYDLNRGVKPYSYLNAPLTPMVLIKGAYGYYRDKLGTHKL